MELDITLPPEKCDIRFHSVELLEHLVNRFGLSTASITLATLETFAGLTGYSRRSVKNYAGKNRALQAYKTMLLKHAPNSGHKRSKSLKRRNYRSSLRKKWLHNVEGGTGISKSELISTRTFLTSFALTPPLNTDFSKCPLNSCGRSDGKSHHRRRYSIKTIRQKNRKALPLSQQGTASGQTNILDHWSRGPMLRLDDAEATTRHRGYGESSHLHRPQGCRG